MLWSRGECWHVLMVLLVTMVLVMRVTQLQLGNETIAAQ